MIVTELIAYLEVLRAEHGDLLVVVRDGEYAVDRDITERDLEYDTERVLPDTYDVDPVSCIRIGP